jgi:membrane fusion protein (multidrug efflux system)
VKVVQRIPVRIDLTNHEQNADHLLRPGMSVVPKVKVK